MKPQDRSQEMSGAQEPLASMDARAEQIREILKHFRMLFRSVQKHSHWVEEQCGVSGAQLWALWELLVSPGLKVGELSRLLSIHQSTASNLLDKLEKRELIRRERGGPDQRIVRLYLNPAGLEIINKAPRPAQGILMGALQHLPDDTLNGLQNALGQVAAHVKLKDESSALKPLSDK